MHDGLVSRLESRSQVLELLIDIGDSFGYIGSLHLVRIDALINEHIEVGIIRAEQLANTDEGEVIILLRDKTLGVLLHDSFGRLQEPGTQIEDRQQAKHLLNPLATVMLRSLLDQQAGLRRGGDKSDGAILINEIFHLHGVRIFQKIAQRYKKICIYAKLCVTLCPKLSKNIRFLMKVINLSEQNSVLNQFLREIRDVNIQKDPMRFRRNIERIGEVMAIEVSKTLQYEPTEVQTPLAKATVNTIAEPLVLATILRAGMPLHQGFLHIFDRAENAFLSAYRRANEKGELEIVAEYMAAPMIDGKTLIVADPMLATGMSMEVGYLALLKHGTPRHTHLCCAIATPQSIEYMRRTLNDREDVTLWCAAVDPILNEKKYIVPGLGDAGDLCYGVKEHLSDR